MRALKFPLFISAFVVCYLLFVFPAKAQAPVPLPSPYVPVGETEKNEWNSLRPYQASPAKIPIQMDEQAAICGNDLIVNDPIYVSPGSEDDQQTVKHNCEPVCGKCKDCIFESTRNFKISFDAFGSELPIAGNTEEVAGNSDWSPFVEVAVELAKLRESWRLKPDASTNSQGFSDHLPPDVTKFTDFRSYYIAYQEWRGKECIETPKTIKIPLTNIEIELPSVFICGELLGGFLRPNFWADLFPKIPYSSTEDRIGKANVSDMVWVPGKSLVEWITPDPPTTEWHPKTPTYGPDPKIAENETPLYFPHMEENVELSSLLQSTYLPKDLQTVNPSPGPNSEPLSAPDADCKIVDVRYNPGDQLFGERTGGNKGTGIPNANVKYHAWYHCQVCWSQWPQCAESYNCVRNAWFYSDVTIFTPLIDELFGRTVNSESAILRRIFPQSGSNTPLEVIKDIPAVTDVGHDSEDTISPSTPTQTVSKPAEFYIPHFGSIYDYLLHDMQTALRPKGFPGRSAGLIDERLIPEVDTVNEYLSWYLNGTINRAEDGPLKAKNEKDKSRIINLAGPINKLLSQDSQWRNTFQTFKDSFVKSEVSKVAQTTPRATTNRHNQIVGCTISRTFNILGITFTIGGIPVPCQSESQKYLPDEAAPPSGGPQPPSGGCPSVPDSQIDAKYLTLKPGFTDWADRLLPGSSGECLGAENNLAEECFNYVVKESKSAGVNPGFSLAIWLHESGASNYCYKPDTEDMGIHVGAEKENLVDQLAKFLLLPFRSLAKDCSEDTSQSWPTPMHGFLCVFANYDPVLKGCNNQSPHCDPNNPNAFYNLLNPYFTGITGCATLPTYPTDNSCP